MLGYVDTLLFLFRPWSASLHPPIFNTYAKPKANHDPRCLHLTSQWDNHPHALWQVIWTDCLLQLSVEASEWAQWQCSSYFLLYFCVPNVSVFQLWPLRPRSKRGNPCPAVIDSLARKSHNTATYCTWKQWSDPVRVVATFRQKGGGFSTNNWVSSGLNQLALLLVLRSDLALRCVLHQAFVFRSVMGPTDYNCWNI